MDLTGGNCGEGEENTVHYLELATLDRSNTWLEAPPMKSPRISHSAVMCGGKLVVVGGWHGKTLVRFGGPLMVHIRNSAHMCFNSVPKRTAFTS